MKRRVVVLLVSVLLFAPLLLPPSFSHARDLLQTPTTDVCGTISTNTTWAVANSPYIVTCYVTVAEGVILTIQPGVVVRFTTNAFMEVYGTLDARGTPGDAITFRSNAATPAAGDWNYILFFPGSSGQLHNCEVAHGGTNALGMLRIQSADLQVQNCEVHHSASAGVEIAGTQVNPHLSISTIRQNSGAAILQFVNNSPQYDNLTLTGNAVDAVSFSPGYFTVDSTLDGAGLNGKPFIIQSFFTVQEGATLTVAPGSTLAFAEGGYAEIYGTLDARGLESQPINFTSSAATPAPGDWSYLLFVAGSSAHFEHCIVAYGGRHGNTMLRLQSGDVEVANCDLGHGSGPGVDIQGNGLNPTFSDTMIRQNAGAAIRQQVNNNPTYDNVTFTGNGIDAVFIPTGVVVTDTVLDGRGLNGKPFINELYLSVFEDATLTLTPGTTYRFSDEGYMEVRGTLNVVGTASQPITITSNAATPAPGDWNYIQFVPGSSGRLEHCTVAYGGAHVTPMLSIASSAVDIRNCDLHHSASSAISVGNAQPLIHHNQIRDNESGVQNVSPDLFVDARHNWWGDPTGPYQEALNPAGLGDAVSAGVLYTPWLLGPDPDSEVGSRVILQVGGPMQASPGETVNYAISYDNVTGEVVEDAVLLLQLPSGVEYLSESGGGVYWPERNQLFWRLGDVVGGASGIVTVELRFLLGLPANVKDSLMALLVGSNLEQEGLTLQDYLDYTPLTLQSSSPLTPAQVENERQSYPDVNQLYNRAIADGFHFGVAERLTLSDGMVIIAMVFVLPTEGRALVLQREGNAVTATIFGPNDYTVLTTTGGMRVDRETRAVTYLDGWNGGERLSLLAEISPTTCFRNCVLTKGGEYVSGKLSVLFDIIFAARTCVTASTTTEHAECASGIMEKVGKKLPGFSEAANLATCSKDCLGSDPEARNKYVCTGALTECVQSTWYNPLSWNGTAYRSWTCNVTTGTWGLLPEVQYCSSQLGEKCVAGFKAPDGRPCSSCIFDNRRAYDPIEELRRRGVLSLIGAEADPVPLQPTESFCKLLNAIGGGCAIAETTIRPARDPNEKYGTPGDLLPGQTVHYTITYENVGEGTAFDVFIVDELGPHFDAGTLDIKGAAQYLAHSRTIVWDIGELAPHGQPGSTGQASFSVRLNDDLPGGTVITNQAVVYFPSVPEITPTGAVINLIQPIAAVPQEVTTESGQPVAVTLRGREVSSAPLSYSIVETPLNGTLSGSPPNLSYTPDEGFTGEDRFLFQVSNGATTSRPAQVRVTVNPSATDDSPLTIVLTDPTASENVGEVSATPVLIDNMGPVYWPLIKIQTSEPPDASTINTGNIQVTGSKPLTISVEHVGGVNQIVIKLREPLENGRSYTVRLTSQITDLAGNPLAKDYIWTFSTGAATSGTGLYLPMVTR